MLIANRLLPSKRYDAIPALSPGVIENTMVTARPAVRKGGA